MVISTNPVCRSPPLSHYTSMLQPAGKWLYTAVWGQVKTVCTAARKANCTEAKEYHPVSILSFIQKKIQ
jgi:hypothetical protein